MTDLYLTDPYTSRVETTIAAVMTVKGCTAMCPTDQIFHPEGGGQPRDNGEVVIRSKTYEVNRLIKMSGRIFLVLKERIADHDDLVPGEPLSCRIDWDRRYKFMRYHTAAHAMMATAKRLLNGFEPRGIEIADNGSQCRIQFVFRGPRPDQLGKCVEEAVNAAIATGATVSIREYESLEAAAAAGGELFRVDSGAKFKAAVRTVFIEGIDVNPCGGTHLSSLQEVGRVSVLEAADGTISFQVS